MSERYGFDTQTTITACTLAAAIATVGCLLLWLIIHPPAVTPRLRVVDQQLTQAERLSETASGLINYPNGAVCRDSANGAEAALQNRLRAAATSDGVALTSLNMLAGDGDRVLVPLKFSLEATGRYEAVVMMVASLSKTQPEIFIDQADLKSQTSDVRLKLNGRVYCSTSARL